MALREEQHGQPQLGIAVCGVRGDELARQSGG
jgi:hypothetical protein